MHKDIINHFKKVDPLLFALTSKVGEIEVVKSDTYFHNLCRSICSQQLSTKSAAAIFKRVKALFPNEEVTPENLLKISEQELRSSGLSKTKISYMQNLANAVLTREIVFGKFADMENEEIILTLTKVKGIGIWTVEMFLMNSMGREDVFSYGDLGLRKAVQRIYGLENLPTKLEMEEIVRGWSPYKTYASKILWQSLTL